MSFLTSLFAPRRFDSAAIRRKRSFGGGVMHHRSGHFSVSGCEALERRLALSVTTVSRETLREANFTNAIVGTHPGQLLIASDQGSDVYLQQVEMTPSELLIADNGSFLDYAAVENVNARFEEFIVTNGSRHEYEESITADGWWLFPTRTNDDAVSPTEDPLSTENLTTTRLALDRPEVRIGPSRDFFGSVSYLQSDGNISKWTFSAWDGSGNSARDYVSQFGESLYITSGPGYGGGPYSFKNTLIAPVEGLTPGYVFPRKISVVTEQLPENLQNGPAGTKQFGGRRHYLEVEWSQVPVTPPVMEANYWGASHYVQGVPQNVRDPLSTAEDVPPTVGIAMRTTDLRVTVPRAITEGSPDGAPSLGIIPGTLSGTLVIGGAGQEEIFEMPFEDRKNNFRTASILDDAYTFFFDDFDNSGTASARRQFGLVEAEIETNIIKDIDWRFREEARRTHTYVEGQVENHSTLLFGIGSHVNRQTTNLTDLNNLYGDNNLNQTFRALEGVNVTISEANLLDGTAREAVRVRDVSYHVYVKPTVVNEVYFVAGADFTRGVTVDLLTDGSSVYVNSPIRVANPTGDIDLRATNVIVNAPMETNDYVILGRSNSEQSPRLPRVSDPQGGEQSTPTFMGSLLGVESTTQTVVATPVLRGNSVETLEVLPGREGYGYDPTKPPLVTIEPAKLLEADVVVTSVSGGVSDMIIDNAGVGYVGEGVQDAEYLDLTFSNPQLNTIESINRWTLINDTDGEPQLVLPPEGYGAAPVIAISPPEIVSSVSRIGYGEKAEVYPDNQWGTGIKRITLDFGGRNYSATPTITLKVREGWQFFDPRVPEDYWSEPTFDFDFDLVIEPIISGGDNPQQTGARYVRGTVNGLQFLSNGFGLNIREPQDLENYYFEVSGGYNPNANSNGFVPSNLPAESEIEHARITINEALFGTLAWKGNSPNDQVRDAIDGLKSIGAHYEASPDVQFVGMLTATAAEEFGTDDDSDGNTGIQRDELTGDELKFGDPVVVKTGDQYKATIVNTQAYADGTDRFPLAKGRFRDVDYLSYLNDREDSWLQTGEESRVSVTALASVDGQTWFRVLPVKADGIENFYWPARGNAGEREIVLQEEGSEGKKFTQWKNLREGMRLEIPKESGGSQVVEVVTWFENTETIVISKPLEEALEPKRDGTGDTNNRVRFGRDKVIVDEYTQQFFFRKVNYDSDTYFYRGEETPFSELSDEANGLAVGDEYGAIDLSEVREFKFYFDQWFENGEIDQELKAFATIGFDPAQGRAVISNGRITNVEVTHPGSGYLRTPTVTVNAPRGGQGAALRSIVSGGIFELVVREAGFNYYGNGLPGLASEVVRDVAIPVFDVTSMPFGARMPVADFIARNTSIRGGSIVDPGAGLKIIGAADSELLAGFNNSGLTLVPGDSPELNEAVFQAVVEADGRILRFEKLRGGSGYRIAPLANVAAPRAPESATAVAHINSSTGQVSRIEVVEEGHRYAHAPKVFVAPPTPRGEGRAARAVAVLGPSGEVMRIDIVDTGSGYTSPPRVEIQAVDAFSVVEYVDIAAHISANKYEFYVSRSSWTDRERGLVLLRPTNVLGLNRGEAEWIFIEAAATDITFEGDVNADAVTVLMNSRDIDSPFAPYSFTTRSTATGAHSGTIISDMLVVTMGNDVPTPLSGGTLANRVELQTQVRSLRATAAESKANPRGAFPYDIRIDELDNLLVEAVPRSGGMISLNVPNGNLDVISTIATDGDIEITAQKFSQTTPLISEFGSISITGANVDVLNSLIVNAAPLDDRRADIQLHATNGSINLQSLVRSPNEIYLRQQGAGQVGGNTRLQAQRVRVEAEGNVSIYTDVDEARGSSDRGSFSLDELDDISIPALTVPQGTVTLLANGVDRGGEWVNPIALSARILENTKVWASTPNGSMDITFDTPRDIDVGILDDLRNDPNVVGMQAAGSVRITHAGGSVNIYDGPVAGGSAKSVKFATVGAIETYAYAGNAPGEFPSTLSGPGRLPAGKFDLGGMTLRVGDRVLVKNQADKAATARFDETRENGVYVVSRLGGGAEGFTDWLLTRAVDADHRDELQQHSYVRVEEGADHKDQVFQVVYAAAPDLNVTRTINNQLVIDGEVGGLLGVKINDVVTGEGIMPGARVTGLDFENGVVNLGIGNGYRLSDLDEANRKVKISAEQSLLYEALDVAQQRGEMALITGDWFSVGAEIEQWDRNTGTLTISPDGIRSIPAGEARADESIGTIGFVKSGSDRVSLNPAVRSFLLNSVSTTSQVNATMVKVVEPAAGWIVNREFKDEIAFGKSSFDTLNIPKDKLGGWTIQRGDEVTYESTLVKQAYGESTVSSQGTELLHTLRFPSLRSGIDGEDQNVLIKGVVYEGADRVYEFTVDSSDEFHWKNDDRPASYEILSISGGEDADTSPRVIKLTFNEPPPEQRSRRIEVSYSYVEPIINRVINVIDGDANPNDRVPNGVFRVEFADNLEAPLVVDEERRSEDPPELGPLPELSFRNRARMVLAQPDSFDWETLHVGMSVSDADTSKQQMGENTTLVDWSQEDGYLVFSSDVETSDYHVIVGDPGKGYDEDPLFRVGVRFSAPDASEINGGLRMEGYAVPDGDGGIAHIVITRQGRGYKTPPSVTIDPPIDPPADVVGRRASGTVFFAPDYLTKMSLENRVGGDDSSLTMAANFTNYDGLRPGQSVFGDGVRPGTVITRVLPALRRVEVTPGGLPVRVAVEATGMTVDPQGSRFYSDGFDHVLQMPDSFNEFHRLIVGQKVEFPDSELATTVITAIDPTYRQIGLRDVKDDDGNQLPLQLVNEVVFQPLGRVEFGMITRTGSGQASFAATPFGYQGVSLETPALTSGVASLDRTALAGNEFRLIVQEVVDQSRVQVGGRITGVGIHPGYRIKAFDGRNISLYSATVSGTGQPKQVQLDDDFMAFDAIREGMPVFGNGVPNGTTITGINRENRSVTLSAPMTVSSPSQVTFGNPFTATLQVNAGAKTAFTIRQVDPNVSSFIGTTNVRESVNYYVSTEGGSRSDAGSLATLMLVAQQNEYRPSARFTEPARMQPTIDFANNVQSIELSEPLPEITSAITVAGKGLFGTTAREVVGRFITKDRFGDNVLNSTEINGFVVRGDAASGTVLDGLKFGGFNNGSAVLIDGASNVLVQDVVIGVTGVANNRSGSAYGVLVTSAGDVEAKNNTVLNSTIVSADRAGVRVEGEATGTRIVGTKLGANLGNQFAEQIFANEVGLEVAANDVRLGVGAIQGAVVRATGSYAVESAIATLTMTASEWAFLRPGMRFVGLGIPNGTVIESVDPLSNKVSLSQAATRTAASTGVLLGYGARGAFESNELHLDDEVVIDRVFIGQTVRVQEAQNTSRELTVVGIDEDNHKIRVSQRLSTTGFYGAGLYLVSFAEPAENRVEYNDDGIVVGLFGQASGAMGSTEIVMDNSFRGWNSLREEDMSIDSDNIGIPEGAKVTRWNEATRTITIDAPLNASINNRTVVFGGQADRFEMIRTTVTDNLGSGLVFGGGEHHRIGVGESVAVSANPDELVSPYELASYRTVVSTISDEILLGNTDASLKAWLASKTQSQLEAVNVYGTGIAPGTTIMAYDIDAAMVTLSEPPVEQSASATLYFGVGGFISVEHSQLVSGMKVEGPGVYDFLEIEQVGRPTNGSVGYIGLTTPLTGLVGRFYPDPAATAPDNHLWIVSRDPVSANVIAHNDRYGITTLIRQNGSSADSFEEVLPVVFQRLADTWRITGNFIDVNYNRTTRDVTAWANALEPLSPTVFAALGNSLPTPYDKTDRFGNQFATQRTDIVPPTDDGDGEVPIDDPFNTGPGEDDPFGTGPGDGGGDPAGTEPEPDRRPTVGF